MYGAVDRDEREADPAPLDPAEAAKLAEGWPLEFVSGCERGGARALWRASRKPPRGLAVRDTCGARGALSGDLFDQKAGESAVGGWWRGLRKSGLHAAFAATHVERCASSAQFLGLDIYTTQSYAFEAEIGRTGWRTSIRVNGRSLSNCPASRERGVSWGSVMMTSPRCKPRFLIIRTLTLLLRARVDSGKFGSLAPMRDEARAALIELAMLAIWIMASSYSRWSMANESART